MGRRGHGGIGSRLVKYKSEVGLFWGGFCTCCVMYGIWYGVDDRKNYCDKIIKLYERSKLKKLLSVDLYKNQCNKKKLTNSPNWFTIFYYRYIKVSHIQI